MEHDNRIKEISELVKGHLHIWNESDIYARIRLADQIYTEDIQVIDPGAILTGRKEVIDFIAHLLLEHPGFKFTTIKPIASHHDKAILLWQFGPPEKPDTIIGQDIFTITNGRISSLLVFVEGVTK